MHIRLKTRLETLARHQAMRCRVFEVKLDKSHLSKKEKQHFKLLFLEAKWFYNHCVQNIDKLKDFDTKVKAVPVRVKKDDQWAFEDREFTVLSGQMKQGIKQRLWTNMRSLSSNKSDNKVGKIGFKSVVSSIPLKQFGSKGTYDFDKAKKLVYIQNIKRGMRARGLDQIPDGCEVANAHLVQRCGDVFLMVTTYSVDDRPKPPRQAIGLDFGCTTPITTSNGVKVDFSVPVPKQVKKLDRWLGRHKKDKWSKNRWKMLARREKAYAKVVNKRRDIRNKIVSVLTKAFGVVCLQDENIKGWQAGGHGKAINRTTIGGITSALKDKAATPVVVDRFFSSSKTCSRCGKKKDKLEQWERVYECHGCGSVMDRDVNAAVNMLMEGMKDFEEKLPEEDRKTMPLEDEASGLMESLCRILEVHAKLCPLNGEVPALRQG